MWYIFCHFLQRRNFLSLPVCSSAHQVRSEKKVTLKEMNLLSLRKIILFQSRTFFRRRQNDSNRVVPTESVSLPLKYSDGLTPYHACSKIGEYVNWLSEMNKKG